LFYPTINTELENVPEHFTRSTLDLLDGRLSGLIDSCPFKVFLYPGNGPPTCRLLFPVYEVSVQKALQRVFPNATIRRMGDFVTGVFIYSKVDLENLVAYLTSYPLLFKNKEYRRWLEVMEVIRLQNST